MSKKTVSGTFTQYAVKHLARTFKDYSPGIWLRSPVIVGHAWYASKRGHVTLPAIQSVDEQTLRAYVTELNNRNVRCGCPILIEGDMQNMELSDWLGIDVQLQKHEALSLSSKMTYEFNKAHCAKSSFLIPWIVDEHSIFMQIALGSGGAPLALGVGLVLLTPALHFHGWFGLGVVALFTTIWALFNITMYESVIYSGKLHDSLVQEVSATWEEVFDFKNYADATLISLMSQAARKWPENVPVIDFRAWTSLEAYAFLLPTAQSDGQISEHKLDAALKKFLSTAKQTLGYLDNDNTSSFQSQTIYQRPSVSEQNVEERSRVKQLDR